MDYHWFIVFAELAFFAVALACLIKYIEKKEKE